MKGNVGISKSGVGFGLGDKKTSIFKRTRMTGEILKMSANDADL